MPAAGMPQAAMPAAGMPQAGMPQAAMPLLECLKLQCPLLAPSPHRSPATPSPPQVIRFQDGRKGLIAALSIMVLLAVGAVVWAVV